MGFKQNMGSVDRGVRVLLAVIFALLIFTGTVTGPMMWILGILAVVFLFTSIVSFCPLYLPLKMSTKK